LYRQKNKPAEDVINLLNEAIDAHFASLKVRLVVGCKCRYKCISGSPEMRLRSQARLVMLIKANSGFEYYNSEIRRGGKQFDTISHKIIANKSRRLLIQTAKRLHYFKVSVLMGSQNRHV